jgi:hypothetical protein
MVQSLLKSCDLWNRCVLAEAEEVDVLFHVEPSILNILTVRLTSYEWNARMFYMYVVFIFSLVLI